MGFFLTFLLYAALLVLTDLLLPKPDIEQAKPAGLGDFRFPTATEGRPIPLIWGTVRLEGPNVVWHGDLNQEAIVEEVKTGLFSSEDVVVGYRYHLGFQLALCMGSDASIFERVTMRKLWIGDDEVADFTGSPLEHDDTFTIDEPELFGGETLGQGGVVGTLHFHAGTDDQDPSEYLEQFQKVPPVTGDTPAYVGVCYLAPDAQNVLLGTSTSVKPWRPELRRIPNGLGLSTTNAVVDGGANIANALYEVMTNDEWGYGADPVEFDLVNWTAAALTLKAEGNGFAFVLDRVEDVGDMVQRLEDQADGVVFKDPFTGLWKFKLIRADYDILTVPEVNADNRVELRNFNRGTWEGTSNEVRVPFNNAADNYKDGYGFAQDMANLRIVGQIRPTIVAHPGCKTAALANALAWRELRTLSQPLVSVEVVVDRSLHGVLPGDVVAFTDADLGFERLPLRVKGVDYGNLLDGEIVLECVQDVFFAAVGSFANPPNTSWEPPAATLVDYPTDERIVIEAPRAFTLRDPNSTTPETDKLFTAARRQGSEVSFQVWQRNHPTTPSGAYTEAGEVFQFMLVGELQSTLPVSATNPAASVVVVPTPDTQADVLAAFPDVLDLVELGTELVSLCMVDEEFFLVRAAASSGGNVELQDVYRGVLDSAQGHHSAGAKVYLLFVGGGMSSIAFPAGYAVEAKLLPRAIGELFPIGSATSTLVDLDNRTRRPYLPAAFDLNGTTLDSTNVDLDGSGTGENVGVLVDEVVRRDFRTVDEVAALAADAATFVADFPAAHSTTIDVRASNPAGPTQVFIETAISGTSYTLRQLDVLEGLDTTSLPSSLTFGVRERHVFGGTTYTSRAWLEVTATIVSDMIGRWAFGALSASEASTDYVVATGDGGTDHDFTLSSAFTLGAVEYRINGGGWTSLIAAGLTTGSIPNASIVDGDVVEVRHGSTDVGAQKLLRMTVGGTLKAYAVLIT